MVLVSGRKKQKFVTFPATVKVNLQSNNLFIKNMDIWIKKDYQGLFFKK